ncbi:unnamed protein product [Vicia faba]|uniref:Uncharacterized protein n=1 Tax=Vicia faba TaxID=3906 RepID=A0AAV1A765_VICFA|nr:unnamed protein product [Vicia faba]
MSHNRITTDSPLSRRIVLSFLHFLNHVEPSPGVDAEGIEVARECLVEAFRINSSSVSGEPDSLVDIFKSFDGNKQCEVGRVDSMKASSSLSDQNAAGDKDHPEASESMDEDLAEDPDISVSKDELCGQFFAALEKKRYFRTNIDGGDDIVQLEKASRLFDNGFTEMEKSGYLQFNMKNLAESLKALGNKEMQSKQYNDAVELYNCAIAINEKNAVYYCNRAAAYTQINKYTEAIEDCLKSIEIDPYYSKAYSRLGLAYYAQGKYKDAIDKGFQRALQLDPNNETVKENIRVAVQKLMEEQHNAGHNQNSRSSPEFQNHSARGSTSHTAPPTFASMQFNPSNLASMFMSATNAHQGSHSQESQENANSSGANEPGIQFGANVNVNHDQIPQDLRGAFQSVMGMFSGNVPPGQPHDQMNGSQEDANSGEANEPEIQFGGRVDLNSDQLPQELRVFQNVIDMLSGNVPPGQPHDQTNERTAPN